MYSMRQNILLMTIFINRIYMKIIKDITFFASMRLDSDFHIYF